MSDTDTKTLEREARRAVAEMDAGFGDSDYDESNLQLLREHGRPDDGSGVALSFAEGTAAWLHDEIRHGVLISYVREELEERTRKAAADIAAKNEAKVGAIQERIAEVAKEYRNTVEAEPTRNLWFGEQRRFEMAAMDDEELQGLVETYVGTEPWEAAERWIPHQLNLLSAELRSRGMADVNSILRDAVKRKSGLKPYLAHPEMRTATDDLQMYRGARHGHVPIRIGEREGQYTYVPLSSLIDKSALRVPPLPPRRQRRR